MSWCDKFALQFGNFTWDQLRPGDLLLFDSESDASSLRMFMGFDSGQPRALFFHDTVGTLSMNVEYYSLIERMPTDDNDV